MSIYEEKQKELGYKLELYLTLVEMDLILADGRQVLRIIRF